MIFFFHAMAHRTVCDNSKYRICRHIHRLELTSWLIEMLNVFRQSYQLVLHMVCNGFFLEKPNLFDRYRLEEFGDVFKYHMFSISLFFCYRLSENPPKKIKSQKIMQFIPLFINILN